MGIKEDILDLLSKAKDGDVDAVEAKAEEIKARYRNTDYAAMQNFVYGGNYFPILAIAKQIQAFKNTENFNTNSGLNRVVRLFSDILELNAQFIRDGDAEQYLVGFEEKIKRFEPNTMLLLKQALSESKKDPVAWIAQQQAQGKNFDPHALGVSSGLYLEGIPKLLFGHYEHIDKQVEGQKQRLSAEKSKSATHGNKSDSNNIGGAGDATKGLTSASTAPTPTEVDWASHAQEAKDIVIQKIRDQRNTWRHKIQDLFADTRFGSKLAKQKKQIADFAIHQLNELERKIDPKKIKTNEELESYLKEVEGLIDRLEKAQKTLEAYRGENELIVKDKQGDDIQRIEPLQFARLLVNDIAQKTGGFDELKESDANHYKKIVHAETPGKFILTQAQRGWQKEAARKQELTDAVEQVRQKSTPGKK